MGRRRRRTGGRERLRSRAFALARSLSAQAPAGGRGAGAGPPTSLSKQAASKVLADLEARGVVAKVAGDLDGRRRAVSLTSAGAAFEDRISERLRAQLARSYRVGGLDGVAGARQILSALAGGRMKSGGA